MTDNPPLDPRAKELGIDPEKWDIVKEILALYPGPKKLSPDVIDDRPNQKKITDFIKKGK
jgi:hypothetical protein